MLKSHQTVNRRLIWIFWRFAITSMICLKWSIKPLFNLIILQNFRIVSFIIFSFDFFLIRIISLFFIRVQLKKSGSRIPRVELEEIGPAVDFRIGRKKLATEDLFKSACKQPTSIDVSHFLNRFSLNFMFYLVDFFHVNNLCMLCPTRKLFVQKCQFVYQIPDFQNILERC